MSESEKPTVDPKVAPEYVGAHSALSSTQCQEWVGETREELEHCENDATHTVVMFHKGTLTEIAMCDECGEPQDVTADDRVWTGKFMGEWTEQ